MSSSPSSPDAGLTHHVGAPAPALVGSQKKPLKRIGPPVQPASPVDRAKNHWLGQLYVRNLKHYPVLRVLVNRGWLALFPMYRRIVQSLKRPTGSQPAMPLVAHSAFVRTHSLPTTVLAAKHEVDTPAPRAYPSQDQRYLKSPHDQYTFPETFVAELTDAVVQGGTNIVVAMGCAIHHDLFSRDEDFTSEELHDRMRLDVQAGTAMWRVSDPVPESMDVAANFADACAPNYAHWLTEVAPRIALFCARSEFDGVPLIVNDELHPNIMESLWALAADRHPVVALPLGRAIKVARLYLVSCAGYVPFEPRGRHTAGMSHGKFSRQAFEAMRQACFASLQPHSTPRRIFLRRNSGMRRLMNSDVIESLLVSRGFTIVEPEKLSFAMQVQLFRQAEIIISPTGAALANIIFSKAETQIAILIHRQEDVSYWYWQNIACACAKTVNYIFGQSQYKGEPDVHADFYVSLEAVEEFADRFV